MKNKIICLLLAVIMCMSCLAGCMGGGGDDTNTDETNNDNNNNNNNNNSNNNDDDDKDEELENGWWNKITYDSQSLIFQMTNSSNNEELPSGCERYLAGESNDQEPVDNLVRERNEKAYENTKVNVKYLYYPDKDARYEFSKARDQIISTIDTSAKDNCPDIFCNWMTDMLLVSLKGKFANLMTADEAKYGKNYFNINLNTDADGNSAGYMSDLMRSLTLNQGQVYVIASDYFIDLIRAFFVVPVNVNLFNTVANEKNLLTDLTNDGKVDISDFFQEVKNGDWTYDRLIDYSKAAYTGAVNGEVCDNDTVLGFALGANGLPAAGMIYTSSAVVINRTVENNVTTYTYPDSNEKLGKIISKIANMMKIDGIMCMDKTNASNLGLGDSTALLGIRHKFTNNTMLFGGVILVGSLEYDEYQNMKKSGGFGVVPVPVYEKGDKYLTQIHVVGRAGGITAIKNEKFSACSAFLQYQTENSTPILDYYYKYNLSYGTAGGVAGNVDMLTYIRNNVRTSFDKLFEDAIGFFYDNGINQDDRYHTKLANNRYEFTDFDDVYEAQLELKRKNLQSLEAEYEKLPK